MEALEGQVVIAVNIEKGVFYSPQTVYNCAVSYLDNFFRTDPHNPRDFSIYTEYRDRTFRSLIFELSTIIDSPRLHDLQEALAAYKKLSVLASDYSTEAMTQDKGKSLDALTNWNKLMKPLLMMPHWLSPMYQSPKADANKGRS
jgi:hypothetical protein